MYVIFPRSIMTAMQPNTVFSNWLLKRGITQETSSLFKLREEGGRLVIPVNLPDGSFSFNKYRRNPLSEEGPKYTYDKGGKLALYGADRIKDARSVLWTEGEMDALVAWSHNIPAVSSTGGAMSVDEAWSELFSNKDVTICFDNDKAGGEGLVRALRIVPKAKVLLLPDKPGVKDISDYVSHGGDLNELLKTARWYAGVADVVADRSERLATWKSTFFHDAYIKEHSKPVRKPREAGKGMTGDLVSRAKEYPIDSLLEIRGDSTRCLWHAESEASLHYYRNQNRLWCFGGCGRGYDAIDVYQKIHNCGFKEAVTALSK